MKRSPFVRVRPVLEQLETRLVPAIDAYIYLDGPRGETPDNGPKPHIEITSWQFGAGTIQIVPPAPQGADKAKLVKLSAKTDSHTQAVEELFSHLFSPGQQGAQDKVKLNIHKAGQGSQDYLKFSFDDVIITSPKLGGSSVDSLPPEQFHFNYGELVIEYQGQDAPGTPAGCTTPTPPQAPQTPPGNPNSTQPLGVNVPDDIAPGDTISGTVLDTPAGQANPGSGQNTTELQGTVVEPQGQPGPNGLVLPVPLILPGSLFAPTLNTGTLMPSGLPGNRTQGGGAANFNELRFEDKKGAEQIHLHAEKNQDIAVENDEAHWVGHDRTRTIDHDETTHVKHDRTETIDNNETITIHGSRTETVDKDETITIHGSRTETVDKNESITVGTGRTETVGGNRRVSISLTNTLTLLRSGDGSTQDSTWAGRTLVLQANDEIVLKTGDAGITLKKEGTITMEGKELTLSGSGPIAPMKGELPLGTECSLFGN